MKKITSGKYISSIGITVMDENGELIDFNNLPLRFIIILFQAHFRSIPHFKEKVSVISDLKRLVIVKKNSRMKYLITGESVKNTSERRR